MAKAGFKLVINARRKNILEFIATDLFDKYKTETVIVEGDLSSEAATQHLIDETAHLPIGIFIINAGYGTSGKFLDNSIESEMNMLDLNCKSVLIQSHAFANRLRTNNQKGAIIMLSSMVAFQGVPNASNYAATKAYVQSLGEGLSHELKSDNIDILCACPDPVNSSFSERANMKMGKALTPDKVGMPILNSIGKRRIVLPGFLTKFLVYNLRMLPRWAKVRIMGKIMSGFTAHQTN